MNPRLFGRTIAPMDGLLRHLNKRLGEMTEAGRAEIVRGARMMVDGAAICFPPLRGSGMRHILAALTWLASQMTMERTSEQMRAGLLAKARKAGAYVEGVIAALS